VNSVAEHDVMSYKFLDFFPVFLSLVALRGLSLGKNFKVNLAERS
jgi:hypothetical protein